MKRRHAIIPLLLLISLSGKAKEPQGTTLFYALPKTVLSITVSTSQQHVYAGPYAGYAKSLLDMDVPQEDVTLHSIEEVRISYRQIADFAEGGSVIASEPQAEAMKKLDEAGFICLSPEGYTTEAKASLPQTEYRLSISPDKARASQMAQMIKEYREDRYNIVTGNTDATYSGDAMKAALDELRIREDKLLEYFTPSVGKSNAEVEFDCIPAAPYSGTIKVEAFCFDPKLGVLPAGSPEGTPYHLEISTVPMTQPEAEVSDKKSGITISCRIPAQCEVKLCCYDYVVCHLRVPIYQLGIRTEINL